MMKTKEKTSGINDTSLPQRLLSLLREQVSLYGRLESLAAKQKECVSDDDTGPLLDILTRRRTISTRLGAIATGLRPIRAHWPEIRDQLVEVHKMEAEKLWEVTKQSLGRLMAGDEQDARLLSARKESIRRELRETHTSTHALSAYRNRTNVVENSRLDEAS